MRTAGRIAALLTAASLLAAFAAPAPAAEPAAVEVGKVRLASPPGGRAALLVPVRYPIQLLGQRFELRLSLRGVGRGTVHSWVLRGRASGGEQRVPERRRSFGFVHRADLGPRLARILRGGGKARPRVGVYASAVLDIDRDGKLEIDSSDREVQRIRAVRAGRRQCSDVAQQRVRPGKRIAVKLPVCGAPVRWRVTHQPGQGTARIGGEELLYSAARRFPGTESIRLKGTVQSARASARGAALELPVQVKVVRGAGPVVVRAIGDSVTAGFGYYDSGAPMAFTSLLSCRPPAIHYNDACSSNSTNTSNEGSEVAYAPDYGLANNVSWVAQWANEHGVTNYQNLAVSGSEPVDWAPGGQFYATTKRIAGEDPDYILMTAGANPLLSEMLLGIDDMGCAIESDVFGGYRECIEEAFAGVKLRAHLESLYRELVDSTTATIYLMQYPLSVPSTALAYSATQIAMMGVLLNEQIASLATEMSPSRLRVVAPPHFAVGVDISPVFIADHSCSRFGYLVDGRSVQSTPTQDELELSHPLSFCPGPAKGPPWVIGADTGIHPSAAGHAQMASQIPAP
jgi:lysophospholipase L1-like esterase